MALSPGRWLRIVFVVVVLGAVALLFSSFGQWLGEELPLLEQSIKSLGWWGPAAFVIIFVALPMLQLPESFLALAGGMIFGLWEGTAIVLSANVLAATFAFYFYRTLFRDRLENLLKKHPKTYAVESAISSEGFKLMVLLRLGPFNYSVLNAILGASRVKYSAFLFSLVGAFPGNFASVYFGAVAKHMAQRSAGTDSLDTDHEIVLVVGFMVTLIVFLFVGHVAKHALDQANTGSSS